MLKFIKLLLGVILILLLIPLAFLLFLNYADLGAHRTTISNWISSSLGREVVIAGEIDFQPSFEPSLSLGKISIKNASWGEKPFMLQAESAKIRLKLFSLLPPDNFLDFTSIGLSEVKILQENNKAGKSNWDLSDGSSNDKPSSGSSILLELRNAEINNLDYQKLGDKPLKIKLNKAVVKEVKSGRSVKIKGELNQQKIEIAGELGDIRSLFGKDAWPFNLKLNIDSSKLSGTGKVNISKPMQDSKIKLNLDIPSLETIAQLIKTELPPLKNLSGEVDISLQKELIKLSQVNLKLGDSDLKGTLNIGSGNKKLSLDGTLASQLLKLTDVNPPSKTKASEENSPEKIFSDELLALEELRSLSADIKFGANELELQENLRAKDVRLNLIAKNGKFNLKPSKATFYDGVFKLESEFDGSTDTPTFELDFNTSGFNYGEMLKSMKIDDSVSGLVNGDIQLVSTGASLHHLASNLSGKTSFESENGTLTNNLLKIISVGIQDIFAPLFGKSSDVKVHCMLSSFTIDKGLLKSENQILDSEVITLFADGEVDLGKERADLEFKIQANDPSVASLIPPFTVSGPFNDLSIMPDAIAALVDVAKTGIEIASDAVDTAENIASLVTEGKLKEKRQGLDRCRHAMQNKGKLWPKN